MNIVAMMVVGQGEGERYLANALYRIKDLADYIVVAGNYKDKKTNEILEDYGAIVADYSDAEWGKEQWRIKQSLFEQYIVPLKPDWVLCLDADEVFDERLTREKLEELATRDEIAFTFYFIQLYDSENQMRVDGSWSGFRNVRFWKYIPDVPQAWEHRALHCGLAPIYAYKYPADSEYLVKHYGYLKASDREKKKARYDKYDPQNWYMTKRWYDSIVSTPEIKPFNEQEFYKNLKYNPKKPKLDKLFNHKEKMNTYYIKNKYGKVVPVNEEVYDVIWKDRVAKGEAVLISDEPMVKKEEAEIIESVPKENELTCPFCGKEAKSKLGLNAHIRKHQKEAKKDK